MSRKKQIATCPCCSTPRHGTEIKNCLSVLEKHERRLYRHYKELGIDSYQTLIHNDFEWACDECIQNNKAILANPALQESAWGVNLAYSDDQLTCRKCGTDFTFTKEEKRQWYETYKFNLDSIPVNCFRCRKEIRQLKAENKIISDILQKHATDVTREEWLSVIDVYRKWDKPEKVKFYEAVLRKL